MSFSRKKKGNVLLQLCSMCTCFISITDAFVISCNGKFTGATFSKGLNRGLGTFLAASLGLLFDHVANSSGPNVEPYIVGGSVFVVGKCPIPFLKSNHIKFFGQYISQVF